MKVNRSKKILTLLLSVLLTFSLTACGFSKTSGERAAESNASKQNSEVEGEQMINAKIIISNKVFTAKFYDNETTRALFSKLPMTVNMTELNGREKYYHLSENLPAKSTELPPTIHAGEIMCWSSNSLVLFYNTFSNSYGGYVKLGYIEDISGLKEVLGQGNVQVTFEASH